MTYTANTRVLRNYDKARFDAQDALNKLGGMLAYLDKYSAWRGAPNVKRHLHALRERSDEALRRYERACQELDWICKYDPSQPRVPAGNSDGGRWTDGGGNGGYSSVGSGGGQSGSALSAERQNFQNYLRGRPVVSQPSVVQENEDNPFRNREGEVVEANLRGRGGGGGFPNGTPAQQVRYAFAHSQSMEDLRFVREIDRNWQPVQNLRSTKNTIETEIAIAESITIQARARLMELSSGPMRNSQTLGDLFAPSGNLIGYRHPNAGGDHIRTVSREVFEPLGSSALVSGRIIRRQDYEGDAFFRQDGSIVGLRQSRNYGLTIDVLRSDNPLFKENFRIHKND